jgi:uncharacterized protein YidB (DUF937 family)
MANENMFGGAEQSSASALFSSEQDRSVALALVRGLASPSADSLPDFRAFAQQLKDHGLAEQVEAWIASRESSCVSPEHLEKALEGTHVIEWLAQRAEVNEAGVAESLSFVLPRIFQELTPFRRVESDEAVHSYLQGLRARLRK